MSKKNKKKGNKHQHFDNELPRNSALQLLKWIVFIALFLIIGSRIDWSKVDLQAAKENIELIFQTIFNPETKHWINENIKILGIAGIIFGGLIVYILTSPEAVKKRKIRQFNRKRQFQRFTDVVAISTILIFAFISLYQNELFTDNKTSDEEIIYPEYNDYVVKGQTTTNLDTSIVLTSQVSDLDLKAENTRQYSQVSKDQTFELFKNDYNFKKYISFYDTCSYMYNMKYLNTYFTEIEISKISKYWKP
jgi:hypothetical protein